jgi:exonuclease VII small subunit
MSTNNKTQNKTSQEVQINWILMQLQQGKQREDFIQEFSSIFKLTERTADTRLKEARNRFEQILEANREENELKLKDDPEWQKTHANLLESKKLIYDSLSWIILSRQKKVKINGVEKTVLDIDLSDARDLKTIWEMNLTGLGEPTTISKGALEVTDTDKTALTEAYNRLTKALENQDKNK